VYGSGLICSLVRVVVPQVRAEYNVQLLVLQRGISILGFESCNATVQFDDLDPKSLIDCACCNKLVRLSAM
jgi:hypothetical protein